MNDYVKGIVRKVFTREEEAKESPGYTHIDKETYAKYNKTRPEGPKPLFCYVPFSNISFSFEGRVLACAYNQKVELGHYPEDSVHDLWFNSVEGNKLREHLEHNDLSYGCKHCKYFFENEKFSGLKPLVFDKYSNYRKINYPRVLEFELSNQCNYECVMCNGKVSSSIRENRDKLPPIPMVYDDAFVEQLEEFIPHLEEAKFYGGEPFLIPIYYKIWDKMLDINPKIKIFVITNGSALNNRIKKMLERGNFDLAVSMDSLNKDRLEGIRLNARKEVMLKHIDWFNEYCKSKKKNLVISFTLMRHNWMDFADMVRFCNDIKATLYVSYLKTPPQFGLWNLPWQNLQEIYEQVKDIDFPDGNYYEKQNRQVYLDFKTYMEHAIETNKVRDPAEIIPFVEGQSPMEAIGLSEEDEDGSNDEMKGQDGKPVTGTVSKANGSAPSSESAKAPAEEYNAEKDYRSKVQARIADYLSRNRSGDQNGEAILQRLDRILSEMNGNVDGNRVFYEISRSSMEGSIHYINDQPDEQLKADILRIFE